MAGSLDLSRRTALGALGVAIGTTAVACAAEAPVAGAAQSITLVAYFSRSGNTRVIAGQLERTLDADLFEIIPGSPYPEDYLETVEQARQERDTGSKPPLKTRLTNAEAYETVYLGFPIWGETAPPVIRSFLSAHDLSGKALRPFITHGGFGLGNSNSVLKSHAPSARLFEAFSMEADQERRTMNEVAAWLTTIQSS
jgi:flavodoxin